MKTSKISRKHIIIASVVFLVLAVVITPVTMLSFACANEVPGNYYGDINGDGYVKADDARLALRAAVKLDTLADAQFKRADMDRDGKVEASDARLILRTAVKLEGLIPIDEEYEPVTDPEKTTAKDEPVSDPIEEDPTEHISADDEAKLKAEEEAKKKDLEKEPEKQEEERIPAEEPVIKGDDIHKCSVCGKNCADAANGDNACAYGGCTRYVNDIVCPHCDQTVKAWTCHTCKNPTHFNIYSGSGK